MWVGFDRAIADDASSMITTPALAQAPNQPVLVQPSDGATGVSTSPTLEVTVSDPNSDPMDVTFYGRAVGGSTGKDFTIIVLPDTQIYSQDYPEIFTSQTNWIANNKDNPYWNIVFVTHVGDIVNTATHIDEYDNADAAMDVLDDSNIFYSVGPGDNDYPLTNYNKTHTLAFPVSRVKAIMVVITAPATKTTIRCSEPLAWTLS